MPHPGWPTDRNPVPPHRNTGLRGEGAGAVHDETERRKDELLAAAAVAQQPIAAAMGGSAGAAIPPPPPPPPAAILDRWHKGAVGKQGGYILISPDHGADNLGQNPPFNSGWAPPLATASTINAGLVQARSILNIVRPGARIALLIVTADWHEDLTIDLPGIDIEGWGRPKITGNTIVGLAADASFHNLDFQATSNQAPLWYMQSPPLPMNFLAVPPGVYGCRFFGLRRAFYAQRRFYAEGSQFFQNDPTVGMADEAGAIRIEVFGGEMGGSHMTLCKIYSTIDSSDWSQWGPVPTAFAIEARALAPGTTNISGVAANVYAHPSSALVLDQCQIEGSLLVEQWFVKHLSCDMMAAKPFGPTGPAGGGTDYEYIRMRGQPLPDGTGTYQSDAVALATFDDCTVKSRILARASQWPVTLGPHAGKSIIAFRHSKQLGAWNTTGGVGFSAPDLAGGVASVVESSTVAPLWTPGGSAWVVNTYGSCPTNVLGNAELWTL